MFNLPPIPATGSKRTLGILLVASILALLVIRSTLDTTSLPFWTSPETFEVVDDSSAISSAIDELSEGVRKFNDPEIAKLEEALAEGIACGSEISTQIIMAAHNWAYAYTWGATGGETYWLESFIKAAKSLGHPFLLAPSTAGAYGPLFAARAFNQRYPGCIKLVVVDPGIVRHEVAESRQMRQEGRKDWLPEHLMVGMDYFNDPSVIFRAFGQEGLNTEWGNIETPFGPSFVVSPNPRPKDKLSHFIPYSIDGIKIGQDFIPHDQRPHGQMYVLGRNTGYLVRQHVWSTDVLEGLEPITGGKLIIGMDTSESEEGNRVLEASNLTNLGKLDRPTFYNLLAHSSVLVGMGGDPAVSPTPYEALFLGVPLINPITIWDEDDKMNRDKWVTLHDWLREVGEPYVYNVFAGDVEGLHRAIKLALANPIDSFVLPEMTPDAVKEQVREFIAIDWKGLAEKYRRE